MVVLTNTRMRALALALLFACRPDLTARQSVVDGPRILAIRSDPAEAEGKDVVSYSALVVDSSGGTPSITVDWALCTARKPLKELEPVNPICTSRVGDFLIPLGQGTTASGKVPSDACRLFGPEVPSPRPGEPFGRPTDPDPTGGYYQPVCAILVAADGDQPIIGSSRLSCGVAGASSTDATEFHAHYHVNSNPTIVALTINGQPAGVEDSSATPLPAGTVAHLEVDWPVCPEVDACGDALCGPDETPTSCAADCGDALKGCGGAERYFFYDAEALHNQTRRESMRASWFATGGSYAVDISGREETDSTPNASDNLNLPTAPGLLHGWVVLRDSRGGVVWKNFVIAVK